MRKRARVSQRKAPNLQIEMYHTPKGNAPRRFFMRILTKILFIKNAKNPNYKQICYVADLKHRIGKLPNS